MRKDKWHFPKFDEFLATLEKSKKECVDLSKMNELILMLGFTLVAFSKIPSFFDENRCISEKYSQSLFFTCFMELLRGSACTVFLSGCGLYKNAFHNIRYYLESIVQSMYMDSKHPNVDFPTKVEILKEVEDLRDYRGVRLIQKLEIEYKDEIKKEYKKLSAKVHFTHKQLVVTASDVMDSNYHATDVDCTEVSNIYDSMRMLYDIFFFLFLAYFQEIKEELKRNTRFIEQIKIHNLTLLSKNLDVKMDRRS
jgi:hypothetical protein